VVLSALFTFGRKPRHKPATHRHLHPQRIARRRTFDNDAQIERDSHGNSLNETGLRNRRSVWEIATIGFSESHFATFPPKLIEPCILAGCPEGGTVLDAFFGAGTTGLVADRLHRQCIGIELNPAYVEIARKRIADDDPLFAKVEVISEGAGTSAQHER